MHYRKDGRTDIPMRQCSLVRTSTASGSPSVCMRCFFLLVLIQQMSSLRSHRRQKASVKSTPHDHQSAPRSLALTVENQQINYPQPPAKSDVQQLPQIPHLSRNLTRATIRHAPKAHTHLRRKPHFMNARRPSSRPSPVPTHMNTND